MSISRRKSPSHPGGFIRRNIIEANNLTVSEAARILGVTRPNLSRFLNERTGLSSTMALRIEKAFDVNMEILMRMQANYEIAMARREEPFIHVRRFTSQISHAEANGPLV